MVEISRSAQKEKYRRGSLDSFLQIFWELLLVQETNLFKKKKRALLKEYESLEIAEKKTFY